MSERFPDLTRTIIDDETGEVLFQGNEGPEIDKLRAEADERMHKMLREDSEKFETESVAARNNDSNTASGAPK